MHSAVNLADENRKPRDETNVKEEIRTKVVYSYKRGFDHSRGLESAKFYRFIRWKSNNHL
jgi:hypothetical protein